MIKRQIARLFYFATLSILLAGSCVGPGIMYSQSPKWFLEEVGPDKAGSFFVAFMSDNSKGAQQLHVKRYKINPEREEYSDVQYRMPEERLSYNWGPGEGSASIYSKTEAQGSQLIQVFVVGDSPWTSLSEYRVVDNKVYPLRYAHSKAWLLLGIVICPILVVLISKRIRRGINRLMRIETKHSEVAD